MGAARNCYIPMPFTRAARITLTNEGKQSSRHWVEINYRTYQDPAGGPALLPRPVPPGHAAARRPLLDPRRQGPRPPCGLRAQREEQRRRLVGRRRRDRLDRRQARHAGHRLGRLFLRILRAAGGLLSLLRRHAAGGAVYHGLPLARARPGDVSRVATLPDRAGQRQPALPQRQLLLQRGLLVSDRAPCAFSETAQRTRANKLGSRPPPRAPWRARA